MRDKFHWYDGWFYDRFIAPNLDETFRIMMAMMKKESTVLDVGCGTGRFIFQSEKRFHQAVGVDLSSRNIKTANKNLMNSGATNLSFIHGNAETLAEHVKKKFDYSTISHVIHEMPEEIRLRIIKNMKEVSNEIIIGDYYVPQPNNQRGISNRIAEVLAGFDHFKNYRSFVRHGGLPALIKEADMVIVQEKIGAHGTFHIVKIK